MNFILLFARLGLSAVFLVASWKLAVWWLHGRRMRDVRGCSDVMRRLSARWCRRRTGEDHTYPPR